MSENAWVGPLPALGSDEELAGKLLGEAFLLRDAANGHRNRIEVRNMQPVPMNASTRVMVQAYERTAALMEEAAAAIVRLSGPTS